VGSISTILTEVSCDFLDFTPKGHDLAPVLHMQMSLQITQQAKNLLIKKETTSF
jgi:hypothetical protein